MYGRRMSVRELHVRRHLAARESSFDPRRLWLGSRYDLFLVGLLGADWLLPWCNNFVPSGHWHNSVFWVADDSGRVFASIDSSQSFPQCAADHNHALVRGREVLEGVDRDRSLAHLCLSVIGSPLGIHDWLLPMGLGAQDWHRADLRKYCIQTS